MIYLLTVADFPHEIELYAKSFGKGYFHCKNNPKGGLYLLIKCLCGDLRLTAVHQ